MTSDTDEHHIGAILVASDEDHALQVLCAIRAEENEACARVADKFAAPGEPTYRACAAETIAAAIRARREG